MTEATLRIKCPSLTCQKILAVPISSRGKTVKCKSCGGMIRIPLKAAPPPPPAADGAENASAGKEAA